MSVLVFPMPPWELIFKNPFRKNPYMIAVGEH